MNKTYEVIRIDFKRELPAKGEWKAKNIYEIELREEGDTSRVSFPCEIFVNQGSEPPRPGEKLTGEIAPNQNPDFAPRFKKEFTGGSGGRRSGGGGSFKPRDPSEIAGARHAHNLLVAAHSFTPLPPTAEAESIQQRIDDLEAFACVLDEKTATISDAAKDGAKPKDESVPF